MADKKIEAYGVKGMDSKPWRKTFKNFDVFDRWMTWNEEHGNFQILGWREVE